MVTEFSKDNILIYQCDECKLRYSRFDIAERCEDWCRRTKSCNLDIIKHAIVDDEQIRKRHELEG